MTGRQYKYALKDVVSFKRRGKMIKCRIAGINSTEISGAGITGARIKAWDYWLKGPESGEYYYAKEDELTEYSDAS